jgi:hypothetical protein
MDQKTAEMVFWIVHLPLMVVFLGGMRFVFARWLEGSVDGQADALPGRKARALARILWRTTFSARLGLLIKAFITEVWFNRRLYRNSRWRWLNHFLLFSGFMLLMALSAISAVSVEILIPFFHLEHVAWIGMWNNPDHPVLACLNDLGSVLMTVGFLFFVVRRYVLHVSQLRTGPMDTWMVVGLGLILFSGWITEVARLNSSHVGATAYFAFVGYPLASLLRDLPVSWDGFEAWMYLIHGFLTSVVIATVPFSKFLHVVAGTIVAIIREMEEQGRPATGEKAAVHVPA